MSRRALLAGAIAGGCAKATHAARKEDRHVRPIALHPENGHYFLFRGRPTVLISSAAHYGFVLNWDLDYVLALDAMHADGMNQLRCFSGTYCERPGDFNIEGNVLAPARGRFLSPWARSVAPGYPNGGNKFDLTHFDPDYLARLHDFVAQAGRRGIVVEFTLFCPFYEELMWELSPMKASNNVNGVGDLPRDKALTLENGRLLEFQEAATRKLVQELRPYDNVYFEICNEPYFGGVTLAWQERIAATIAAAESDLPPESRHLIAQNVANGSARIDHPVAGASIFNFHYASPPTAVGENYGLDRPIAFDETGFKGTADATYRREAWEFLLAGGAVFSNLDYSFTVRNPDGTHPVQDPTPGGGSPALRHQLAVLRRFVERLDFIHMAPDHEVVRRVPEGVTATALSRSGHAYAIYLHGGHAPALDLALPAGRYHAEWVDTLTGEVLKREDLTVAGQDARVQAPGYPEDVALRITAGR